MVVWPRSKPHAVEEEAQPLGSAQAQAPVWRASTSPATSCSLVRRLSAGVPPWDTNQAPLRGYFEAVYDIRNAGQSPVPVMASDADIVRCAAPWPGTAARLLEGLAALGPGIWSLEQICRASASGLIALRPKRQLLPGKSGPWRSPLAPTACGGVRRAGK